MADDDAPRPRYGEAFWRAHHEAWKRSDLNQREYCEAQRLSLKAFGNWRAKFKVEPQLPARKLLYRRGGASHSLSHTLSHTLSHVTYPSSAPSLGPVVPPARAGLRQRFSEIERFQRLIKQLKRARFDRRSERLDPGQLALGLEDLDADMARAEAGHTEHCGVRVRGAARTARRVPALRRTYCRDGRMHVPAPGAFGGGA